MVNLQRSKVLQIASFAFPPSWRLPEHAHETFNETLLIVRGGIEVKTRSRITIGRVGDMITYPRGLPHAERCTSSRGLEMRFAVWSHPSSVTAAGGASAEPLVSRDHDGCVYSLFQWMLHLSRPDDGGTSVLRDAALRIILHEHLKPVAATSAGWTAAVRNFVREHLADAITLDELAALAGMSRFPFIRRFDAAIGMTPMHYVRHARVEAVRQMLLVSPLPLFQIAAMVGFRDEFELSRVFKRQTGVAPGRWRTQFMGGRSRTD